MAHRQKYLTTLDERYLMDKYTVRHQSGPYARQLSRELDCIERLHLAGIQNRFLTTILQFRSADLQLLSRPRTFAKHDGAPVSTHDQFIFKFLQGCGLFTHTIFYCSS